MSYTTGGRREEGHDRWKERGRGMRGGRREEGA